MNDTISSVFQNQCGITDCSPQANTHFSAIQLYCLWRSLANTSWGTHENGEGTIIQVVALKWLTSNPYIWKTAIIYYNVFVAIAQVWVQLFRWFRLDIDVWQCRWEHCFVSWYKENGNGISVMTVCSTIPHEILHISIYVLYTPSLMDCLFVCRQTYLITLSCDIFLYNALYPVVLDLITVRVNRSHEYWTYLPWRYLVLACRNFTDIYFDILFCVVVGHVHKHLMLCFDNDRYLSNCVLQS